MIIKLYRRLCNERVIQKQGLPSFNIYYQVSVIRLIAHSMWYFIWENKQWTAISWLCRCELVSIMHNANLIQAIHMKLIAMAMNFVSLLAKRCVITFSHARSTQHLSIGKQQQKEKQWIAGIFDFVYIYIHHTDEIENLKIIYYECFWTCIFLQSIVSSL